jgi:soluble lytic murein transglycosylase-like protein
LASGEFDENQSISVLELNSKLPGESIPDRGNCEVSNKYPESVLQWCDFITVYAEKFELSPDLIAAMIWQESGGKHRAYSKSGAVGLMQVMPRDGLAASFMCKNGPCFAKRPTIDELQDPEFNIKYGTKMMARLINQRGNIREALKSYGPKDVGYYYADKVLGIYSQYGG